MFEANPQPFVDKSCMGQFGRWDGKVGIARKKRILIVEDDVAIRESLSEMLQHEGFVIISAANGQEAIDLFHEVEPPDLVITDLMMPIKNGNELIIEIQRNPLFSKIPIVVMSATISALSASGVSAVLSKPIDVPKLLKLVKNLL